MPRPQVLQFVQEVQKGSRVLFYSDSNESDLNKNYEYFDSVTLYKFYIFTLFSKKKYNLKLKRGALHFVNIHHGEINMTQCMHTPVRTPGI